MVSASASPRPGVFMAMHFNRYYCGAWTGRDPGSPGFFHGLHGLSKASGPVPGRCHLTYLIKKDGWINEVGPGWPCLLSCENRFSESWQVIPILVKIRRLWLWSESRAQLLNHIHLIWIYIWYILISDPSHCAFSVHAIISDPFPLSPCFARMDSLRKTVKSDQTA